jgi:hypothetical protein
MHDLIHTNVHETVVTYQFTALDTHNWSERRTKTASKKDKMKLSYEENY